MSYVVFRQKIGDLKINHKNKYGVLDTISKTKDFYGPIQDHKTLCATSFFDSKKYFTTQKEISHQLVPLLSRLEHD